MNPSLCTVVILHQSYVTHDGETYGQLFNSYFGKVVVQHDTMEAIEKVEQSSRQQPTLFLVDLDAMDIHEESAVGYIQTDSSTCCSTRLDDTRHLVRFISKITRDLNTLPNYVPLVVCSSNDDTERMLDCIHAGATDYLLKPLYPNVIKTLFLKLHASQAPITTRTSDKKTVQKDLHDRINDMSSKDLHLTKIMMDVYGSPATSRTYPTLTKKRSSELKSKVCSWDFSPFGLSESELVHCVYLVFDQVLKLPELYHISITQAQLYDFILDLASVYHDENPYHNFAHAVDVLQCLFYMLCELGVLPFTNKFLQRNKPQALLRPKDVFALLIAAIGHDAAHPGVNNMFLINSANPLATLYNDRSVLESLHSVTLFQLLNKHGIDRLVGDPKSDAYKDFRKTVVSSILATDMSLHNEYVTKIQQQAMRFSSPSTTLKNDEAEERQLICSALIKCADISNVARPFHWSTQWAELLVKEFINQGDLEKELGMPVLPMNDRSKVVLEDSQIGFIRFVALGLFQNVSKVLAEISFAVDQMQINLSRWESQKKQEQNEEEFEVISNSSTTKMMMVETGVKRSGSALDHPTKRVSLEKFAASHTVDEYESDTPAYCQCTIQ